jgi:hypothetical protein
MSKIEVNAIEPQSGTTLTIGASGDTVTLAAGASQSGFGRSGSVNWDTTAKTTGFTAVNGNGYFVNTTAGAITVTLPATPAAGDIVAIADYANTAATNNITVGRNGSLIDGETTNAVISINGQVYTLVYVDATEGWKTVGQTFNQIPVPAFVAATGGTVTTCGNFKIHTFTGPGTFTVSSAGNASGSNSVEYLVLAGGGGGGSGGYSSTTGGGGGAGGFRQNFPSPTSAGLPVTATAYPISVGGGGAGGPAVLGQRGVSGSNSIFSTITSAGGGGAGTYQNSGLSGGSGGGGGAFAPTGIAGGAGNTPPVSPSQGNDGGPTTTTSQNSTVAGGGGGGAGAVGTTGTSNTGGPGGAGTATSISGSSVTYAGGGGGGANTTAGSGGSSIGGAGGQGAAAGSNASPANRGSGGGGGSATSSPGCYAGGSGSSGIVIVRYKFQ